MQDSEAYRQKKSFFDKVLTVYGRKAVLEALQDSALSCHAVHLAESNLHKGIIADIQALAQSRDIPLKFHNRLELSRISKNGKQDQGVAADIICPSFDTLENYLHAPAVSTTLRLLALDGISNPQNLGMIIRSAAAGNIDGIIRHPVPGTYTHLQGFARGAKTLSGAQNSRLHAGGQCAIQPVSICPQRICSVCAGK